MNKEQLDLTLKLAVDEGISLRESTKEALQELTNPHYTVTLAGCFQVLHKKQIHCATGKDHICKLILPVKSAGSNRVVARQTLQTAFYRLQPFDHSFVGIGRRYGQPDEFGGMMHRGRTEPV